MEYCVCGSEQTYPVCCGRFVDGKERPATPEELMRSRYTAFTQAHVDYLARTMKSPALDHFDADSAKEWALSVEWLKLEVMASSQEENLGYVEFLAHFYQNKKRHVIHERSEFHREEGIWYYVDGKAPKDLVLPIKAAHIGRNDACLCGSSKKYKKCCGGIKS